MENDTLIRVDANDAKKLKNILWLSEVTMADVSLVGGKSASLGEMYQKLTPVGIKVPNAFCVTAFAYDTFISPIRDRIRSLIQHSNLNNTAEKLKLESDIKKLGLECTLPHELKTEIKSAYHSLSREFDEDKVSVAVRSSATAEDLPDASFAGQQDSYLHVYGEEELIEKVKSCMMSVFTARAIGYREEKNFNHFDVKLTVTVQKMVNSDEATSGVIFTVDTNSHNQDYIRITAGYGLGEYVVNGTANPDEYLIFKPSLRKGNRATVKKSLGSKNVMLVHRDGVKKEIAVSRTNQKKFALTRYEINKLAKWALIVEDHYTTINPTGENTPMDLEWAKDAETGELFVVQARPETVSSRVNSNILKSYRMRGNPEPVLTGVTGHSTIGYGVVRVVNSLEEMCEFKEGEVLVAKITMPDWEPIMKKSAAIITQQGGRTCHAAIIAREFDVTCVIGVSGLLDTLKTGDYVTVDGSKGENGYVYRGHHDFDIDEIVLDEIPDTKAKIGLILGDPEQALKLAQLPVDLISLTRLEFILKNIGVHPLALVNYENLDQELRDKISQITSFYNDKSEYFVDNVSQGIAMIASAFYPRPVIIRHSDFKSNEYKQLIGGSLYEPDEENPMLGWRGASRYVDPKYRLAFDLECRAIKRARTDMGLSNIKIMIPFCRSPKQCKQVLEVLAENGLERGKDGLEIYIMAELPTNFLRASEFCELVDGFSIGSNDTTQLTLGTDRDSELVADTFDENDLAVRSLIKILFQQVEEYYQKTGIRRQIGICGQGPSDKPEFAKFLVELGIDSLGFTPDSALKMRLQVAEFEKN
jgi:pyruvate, water dikinase